MLNFKNILLSYKIFLKVAVTIRLTNNKYMENSKRTRLYIYDFNESNTLKASYPQ